MDGVSNEHLLPPIRSLRLYTRLQDKRPLPTESPQLSAKNMSTQCVSPDMKYVGPGWGDWLQEGTALSCW